MNAEDRDLMAYIDREVRAVCQAKGWGHQIRRAWSARETPVGDSPLDDYEWKLVPDVPGQRPVRGPNDCEGYYYVVSFDRPRGRILLQHDTAHAGVWGPHFEEETFTAIRPSPAFTRSGVRMFRLPGELPPEGWLRGHLLRLTGRWKPSHFSRT